MDMTVEALSAVISTETPSVEVLNDDNLNDDNLNDDNLLDDNDYPPNVKSGDVVAVAYENKFCFGVSVKSLDKGVRNVIRVELLEEVRDKLNAYKIRKTKKKSLDVQYQFVFDVAEILEIDGKSDVIKIKNYANVKKHYLQYKEQHFSQYYYKSLL